MTGHLATYVGLADRSEQTLADSLRAVAEGHAHVPDVFHTCHLLAGFSDDHRAGLQPVVDRYGEDVGDTVAEPERLHAARLGQVRSGEIGLLRDLQDLHVLATLVQTTWTVVAQAAQGLRDRELEAVATGALAGTARQLSWLMTRIKAAAPQALIVTPRRTAAPRPGTPDAPRSGHRSRLSTLLIDVPEDRAGAAASFWSGALGVPAVSPPGEPQFRTLQDCVPDLVVAVQAVDDAARFHVDVETDDVAAEVRRLTGLGAVEVSSWQGCHTLEVPGGHLLCVIPLHSDPAVFARLSRAW